MLRVVNPCAGFVPALVPSPRTPAYLLDGRGGGVVAMSLSTQVTISTEQVDLLSVTGRLDDTGLTQLRMQLEALFDTDTVYLVVDLAGVTCCDYRLFDVLTRTHQFLADHQGWMRLVGIGPAVINALDEALPSEFLLVCQAGDWGAGRADLDRCPG
jgi:anti-anti-sigma regulatory factor